MSCVNAASRSPSYMTTIMPFATDYAFDLRGHTSTVLGTAIGSMLLALPIWLPLSRRVGKRNLWHLILAHGFIDTFSLTMIYMGVEH